jgi:hypothetical protein
VTEAKCWIDEYIDLEQTIGDLVDRKKALDMDSPEYQLINRELTGLRYSREEAGGIIEDLDRDWGSTFRRHEASASTDQQQVLPFRRSGSPTTD